MEMLNAYLRDLLILHDCVIIPEFGGFVANYKAAEKSNGDYFSPPKKNVAFNPQLKDNDALFANTIMAIEKIDYKDAMSRLTSFVAHIQKELKANSKYVIPSVGTLMTSEEERILFTPDTTSNLLATSFGLSSFQAKPTLKEIEEKPQQRTIALPLIRKIMIAGVSGFALVSLLLTPKEVENTALSSIAPIFSTTASAPSQEASLAATEITATPIYSESQEIEATPYEATKLAEYQAPEISNKRYCVIVGCFSVMKNAAQQQARLEDSYDDISIFPYKGGLFAVSAGSFSSFEETQELVRKLRASGDAPSAWVLKKKLK